VSFVSVHTDRQNSALFIPSAAVISYSCPDTKKKVRTLTVTIMYVNVIINHILFVCQADVSMSDISF
jgi:hypothetical protein